MERSADRIRVMKVFVSVRANMLTCASIQLQSGLDLVRVPCWSCPVLSAGCSHICRPVGGCAPCRRPHRAEPLLRTPRLRLELPGNQTVVL